MDVITGFFQRLGSLEELIRWGGYAVLVTIVFAETGLLIGFFLPGDSLLVIAGVAAANGFLDITTLIILLCVAAIAGNAVGYWFGYKVGPRLYARPDSRFFKKAHLLKAQAFYETHGGKAIVLARFIPIVRTFATIVAGAAKMDYRRFMFYNVTGGIGWVVSCCLLGYFLGKRIPADAMSRYLHVIVAAIIVLSVLPPVLHVLKGRRAARAAREAAAPLEMADR
jgi:membrane-associated protein